MAAHSVLSFEGPLGTNFLTKMFKFRGFINPSDQNELYHTPLLSKIRDLIDRKIIVGLLSFKLISNCGTLWKTAFNKTDKIFQTFPM